MQQSSTILIVDDHLSAREVLKGLLIDQGYSLVFATNGEEALTKATELSPDLILLDVMMSEMNGFEVCQHLRADPHLAEVPVIMITALEDEESRLQGLAAGADDFISKPFNRLELQARVKTVIRLNRYRQLLLERSYRQQAEDEVYRRNQELTLLNYVIITAASTLNIEDALYVACEALAQMLEFTRATAILLDQEQSQFTAVVEYAAPELRLNQLELNNHYDETLAETIPIVGLLSEYLPEYETALAIVDEQTLDPNLSELYHLMRDHGYQAMIIVPILTGDKVVGVIELKSTEPRSFSKQNLTLAQSVATPVGQAIETISLYQNLQQHVDHLEETILQLTQNLQTEIKCTHTVLEAVNEAVFVIDSTGVIQYLNQAVVALTGFSAAEAKGQSWHIWQLCSANSQPEHAGVEHLHNQILESSWAGEKWQGEICNTRKDGSRYEALLTITPFFDPDYPNQAVGFVGTQSNVINEQ